MDRIEIITVVLTEIFNKNNHDLYDVGQFCNDVRSAHWSETFNIDSEFQVDFNCALMNWCHQDKHFMLAGQVIIFSELSDWAMEAFNV